MQCPKCNAEVNHGAKFCTACGQDLASLYTDSAPPTYATPPPASPAAPIKRAPLPTGKIVPVVLVMLLLALAAWGYNTYIKLVKPDQVCEQYMEAMKSGKYGTAYGLLDERPLADQPFLTKDWFTRANKDLEISRYQINSTYSDKTSAPYLGYTIQTFVNGASKTSSLDLINIGSADKPKWRVDPSPMVANCSFTFIPGAKAWIDGEAIPLQDGQASIVVFQGLRDVAITWEGAGAKSDKKDFSTLPSSIDLKLEPDEKLQDNIKKVVTGYSQTVFTTLKDYKINAIAPYVKKDSSAWQEVKEEIEDYKESGWTLETSIEGLTLSNYQFKNSLDIVQVKTRLTMTYKIYSGGSIIDQGNHESANAILTLEKQSDGKWLVINDR